MKTFDYRAAWEDLAQPAFESVDPRARAIYEEISTMEGLRQGTNLAVPIPEELRHAFDAIPAVQLAIAARVLYFFDHWGPNGESTKSNGAGWKFANMADQVLAERYEIPSRFTRDPGRGKSVRIIEGVVRIQFATVGSWQWVEIGTASPDVLRAAMDLNPGLTPETFTAEANALRDHLIKEDPIAGLIDTSTYMVEEGHHRHDCPECHKSPLWSDPKSNHASGCSVLAQIIEDTKRAKVDALNPAWLVR